MLVDFGKAKFVNKSRWHPNKLRAVLDRVRSYGLLPTPEAVRDKFDQPIPAGRLAVG